MAYKLLSIAVLSLACSLSAVGQAAPGVSDSIQQHMRSAQQDMQQKRPDLAVTEFEAILAIDPVNLDAQANLGVLYYFKGDAKKAAPYLRAAVQAKPESWKLQALLGLAEFRLGDTATARADLELTLPHLKGEKVQAEAGNALIESYNATGDLDKAASVVSVLLESQPTDPNLLLMSYRMYSDLASNAMLTLALVAPHGAEMHQVMGRELNRHGDEAAAIANYREAISLNPKLPGLSFELGELLYYSSDTKLQSEAEAQFQASLAANPQDSKSLLFLGEIAAKRGDQNAAISEYSRALELDPNDSDACTKMGKLLVSMDQKDKAQKMFERAIQIDPTDVVAHFRLSGLYREAGKTAEAKEQVALYLKYKQMKEKLGKVFSDMKVDSGQHATDDDEEK
ncbi:MAG: tetratricopeptide repeat protein [Terracidiphilus sp.]|jgi:tetratricopeptide (TPR) repeat protein